MPTYVVLEFPVELNNASGDPCGNNRGYIVRDEEGERILSVTAATIVEETEDLDRALELVSEGECAVAGQHLLSLLGFELGGLSPGHLRPDLWEHVENCDTCNSKYMELKEMAGKPAEAIAP